MVTKTSLHAAAGAAALVLLASHAHSAGLGKLTVLSNLGEPFRAEIDLVAVKKEELGSLGSKLAGPDAFRQADLPYTAYVSNLKLSIEKRPNGEPYVKIGSYQPLNEPFIDFLVELSWNSGRLVRAYTALVDPPVIPDESAKTTETKPAAARTEPKAEAITEAAPAPAAAKPEPMPKPTESAPRPSTSKDDGILSYVTEPDPPAKGAKGAATRPPRAMPEAPAAPGGEHKVKRGDTLSKIALAHKPEGMSLDQMLVLLYRANPEAFDGKNMNRLKAGKVLRIPDASEMEDLPVAEARKEVRTQTASWKAYRERLAAAATEAPEKQEAAARTDTGKVAPKADEPAVAPAEVPKDVVKLSKGEPGKDAKPDTKATAKAEDDTAKAKAGKEADARVAQLEKNIKDMQSLMEMKNKGLTDAQKGAAGKPADAAKTPEPAPPAAEPPKVEPPPAPAPAVEVASAPTAMPPADVSGRAEPPEALSGPVAEAPSVVRKPFVPLPPPPPPSLIDQLLTEPLYQIGAAAVAALVAGLAWFGLKRRKGGAPSARKGKDALAGGAAAVAAAGAAAVPDTTATTEMAATDLSSDSDPLQEAEIFISYGRDNLAEQRLREGIAADPGRLELHSKLLEVIAKRGDAAAFESAAKPLQQATGGVGAVWGAAAALGRSIDPTNPRYGGDGAGGPVAAAYAAMPDEHKTDLDFNLGGDDTQSLSATDLDLSATIPGTPQTDTDIDLSRLTSLSDPDSTVVDLNARLPNTEDTMQMAAFDPTALPDDTLGSTTRMAAFDPSEPPAPLDPQDTIPGIPGADLTGDDGNMLDFELDAPATPTLDLSDPGAVDDGGITFDLTDLGGDSPAGSGGAPDLDLSGISLDLGGGAGVPAVPEGRSENWYDVQTKLDLAKAYQEMGDKEGTREVLQEVLTEGDAEQRSAAQAILDALG